MKKGVAVALAATMVLGSTVTAFAADTNSGSATGTGDKEGHVEKKLTNVVLPTESEAASTFDYTMDPERLISETEGGKYETGTAFPDTDDTGVYFLTGDKKYENSSKKLKVENQSSHDIDLTVKAEAETAATDIPLVAKDAVAAAEDASLYLGLVVGADAGVAISKDAAATKKVTIAGREENFKVAAKADKSGYEYRVLSLDEYKALDGNSAKEAIEWDSKEFQIEGATTEDKAITDATTAPKVKVTWSWVDPDAVPEDAAPSIATTSYSMTAGTALEIPVDLGAGDKKATGISKVMYGTFEQIEGGFASYADGKLTLTSANIDFLISQGGPQTLTVIFNDTDETSVDITLQ